MTEQPPSFVRDLPPEPGWRGYFLGAWRVSRRIWDARTGGEAEMTGLCRFEPLEDAAGGLRQQESVETLLDGRRYPATQTYLWRFPSSGPIELHFADNRFFCAADLGPFHPDASVSPVEARLSHFCSPDQYDGALAVEAANLWRWAWRVTGPRKNYRLAAVYQRAEAETVI